MHPVIFETDLFGLLAEPWSLHTYGLLIASGFLLGMVLAAQVAKQEGEDPDRVVDLAFYLLLAGLIGSRVVFIITKWDEYLEKPAEIFMFWRGGLVWYGGFIAAALFVFYYCRRYRLNYFKMADILMPFVALAHAFGRFGCLAAGCCFGKPTTLPWGINFPLKSMAHSAQQNENLMLEGTVVATGEQINSALPVHPTQLYEAGFELLMFWLIVSMRPRKRFHGQLFLMWLAAYPVARSVIEVFRGDKERGVYLLSTSQWISILVGATAAFLFFYLRKSRAHQLNTD